MWTPDPSQIITAEQKIASALEAVWDALRNERDRRLSETDFTQVSDWPSDAEPWRSYRQALRDLPQNTTDPFNPEWPDEPS